MPYKLRKPRLKSRKRSRVKSRKPRVKSRVRSRKPRLIRKGSRVKSRVKSRKPILKSRKRSRIKSRKPKLNTFFSFNSNKNKYGLYEPLTIYTKEGCGACVEAKRICTEKGIKFSSFKKEDFEEKIKKDTNGYKYVPVIFDSSGKFIGGAIDLKKIVDK